MSASHILGWFIIGASMSLAVCFLIAWSVSNGERWACGLWRRLQRLYTPNPIGRHKHDRID